MTFGTWVDVQTIRRCLGEAMFEAVTRDGIMRVASLPDLFATELNVIYQRAEPKDYLDIHAIQASGCTLDQGVGYLRRVYGDAYNIMLPLQALCYLQEASLKPLPEPVKQGLQSAEQSLSW